MPAIASMASLPIAPTHSAARRLFPVVSGVGEAAKRRGRQRAIGTEAARERRCRSLAARREAQHLPAFALRRLEQRRLRVHGGRVPHALQEGDVFIAVRVAIAARKRDLVRFCEIAHGIGLAGSPERRALDAARQATVTHHRARTQQMLDPQFLGDRGGLVARGRGRDRHGMPHFLMSLHEAPGLGKKPAGDLFLEQTRPELGELLFRMTGPFGHGFADDVGEFVFVHVAAQGHPNDVRSLAKTHLAATEPVGEDRPRRNSRRSTCRRSRRRRRYPDPFGPASIAAMASVAGISADPARGGAAGSRARRSPPRRPPRRPSPRRTGAADPRGLGARFAAGRGWPPGRARS